jgi:hypothetical protein
VIPRALAVLLAVTACTRAYNPKAHLGTDGTRQTARELELRCDDDGNCSASRRDVVTWRGGDRLDWYVVHLPPSRCGSAALDIKLQWEAARPPMRFAIDAMLPRADREPLPIWRKRGLENARTRLDELGGGPIYLRVAAHGRDSAGTYRLRVHAPADRCPLAADIYQPRPEQLPVTPPGTIAVLSAGMSRNPSPRIWWSMPSIVIDATDPAIQVGSRGLLLEPSGQPARDAEIEVMTVWSPDVPAGAIAPRFASARLIHAGAFRNRLRMGWTLWTVAPLHRAVPP